MEAMHLSEPSLVRLVINALQGVECALATIEKLSPSLLLTSADRTSHRIPDLWTRCLSTVALGNLLNSIGQFGCIIFLLRRFVDYFTKPEIFDVIENKKLLQNGSLLDFGLINQAFAISVGRFIEGYISALNTLSASVTLRCLSKEKVEGCLTGIGHSAITLLEVYLHTTGLRTQMEALGNLCKVNHLTVGFPALSLQEIRMKANFEFISFPRSGALLSFLYAQLKVADPENCALLKFLFLQSYEPYYGFIRSWIYEGTTNDPYNEFVVDSIEKESMYESVDTGVVSCSPLPTTMVRVEAYVPCFLKECLVPLVRTGQQLQVIIKLLEMSNIFGSCDSQEEILPSLIDLSLKHPWFTVPFTFDKGRIEAMVHMRASYYEHMSGKIEGITNKIKFVNQQAGQQLVHLRVLKNLGENFHGGPSSAVDRNSNPQTEKNFHNKPNSVVHSEASSISDEYSFSEDNLKSSDYSSSESSEARNENKDMDVESHSIEENYLSNLFFPLISSKKYQYEGDTFCLKEDFGSNVKCQPNLAVNMDQKLSPDTHTWFTGNEHYTHLCDDKHWELCLDQPDDGFGLTSQSCPLLNLEFDSSVNASRADESNKDHNQCLPSSSLEMFGSEIWNRRYHSEIFSSHRLLKQSYFFKPWVTPAEKYYTASINWSFDFSIVNDPIKGFMANLVGDIVPKDAGLSSAMIDVLASSNDARHCCTVENNGEIVISHDAKTFCVKLPPAENKNGEEFALLKNISGGSSWESMLGRSEYNVKSTVPIHQDKLVAIVDLPLDFVIKKSLLDEILLQYRYLSKLIIKLLTEGFKLQEHLQALRCYHFMERADWADLFIKSLQHLKLHDSEVDKRIPQIQRALELAIQRSSCEGNSNKDRLYVYPKEEHIKLFRACAMGINCVSFLGLGYQIEWPVSMILTPAALAIYSDVFNFLMQVKLAIFSLSEAWVSLKCYCSGQHSGDMSQMSLLAGTRHMIFHFVSTLQQYVQMQLSQVCWHRFLQSLKFKVKDMFDLEARHMDYLTESLQICFLSDETKPISVVIQSILQCAMDYHSCVMGRVFEATSDAELVDIISQVDILQIHSIRTTFMKRLEDLYLIHMTSLKNNSDFTLGRLWDLLNYNQYHTEVMSKQIGNFMFY